MQRRAVRGGVSTYKSIFFCYPLILFDHVRSVIQRARFREVSLFDYRGQFIEGINRTLHKHRWNTRQEVDVVIEQFKRLEKIVDGTVFPEKRLTRRIECQRDNETSQSNIQPVILICSFLEVLIG